MSEPIRILIVEDMPPDADLAMREIRKSLADCVFQRVETEPDYLDALENFKPDLILSDYHLPHFNGMEALKLALERAPLTPLIIFTGTLSEDTAVDCMKAGAVNYIIKENIKRLGIAVVHALEEKKIRIERDQKERDLRESEKRFRTALQDVPTIAVQGYAMDGTAHYWNSASEKLYGYSAQEAIGRNLLDLIIPAEMQSGVRQSIQQMAETGQPIPAAELSLMRKDGSRVTVFSSHSIVPSIDGAPELFCLDVDLTDRKRAEDDLRESEQRYHSLFSNMLNGFAYCKVLFEHGIPQDFIYLEVNDAFEKLTGFKDVVGKKVTEIIPGIREADPELFEIYGQVALTGKPASFEIYLTSLGAWHSVSLYSPQKEYFVSVFDVITERKRAQEEIVKLAKFPSENPNSVLRINGDGVLIYANAASSPFLELWECVIGDLVPQFWRDLTSQSLASGENNTIDAECNGRIYLMSAAPIAEMGYVNFYGRDITERKRAEAAILESERQMRALVTSLDDIVFELDERGTYLNIWTADESLLARPKAQMLGQGIVEVMGQENGRPFAEALQRVLASGHSESIEYPLEVMGGPRWFVAQISPILTQNDSPRTASVLIRDISGRKQTEEQIQLQLRRLSALSEIDRAISSSLDMRLSLDILLSEVLSQLGVDAASVLLLNTFSQTLEHVAGKGYRTPAIRQTRMRLGEGLPGRVGLERKVVHIPDLVGMGKQFRRTELLKDENFVEYFGVPLIAKGTLKGVLEIFNRSTLDPDLEWENYLETLGGQAAIAIDSAQLFDGLQQSNMELITAYDATIAGWSHAMDLRDKETEGHTLRVTELTLKLADKMGIDPQELTHIRRGALLHDIGKLGVPDHILHKPGPLTEEEWDVMRQHPAYAQDMLLPIAYLRPALDIPYCHHEKWDGTGYPRKLSGEQIPLAARLFAVVDVWDALRSDRPYRAKWTVEQTREHILEQSGKHFEPKVVDIFLSMIESG